MWTRLGRVANDRSMRVILLVALFAAWTAFLPILLAALSQAHFTFDVGGALGGIATLAAAAVAWIAAQQQIAKQQATLELVADEHRKRQLRVLFEISQGLDRINETTSLFAQELENRRTLQAILDDKVQKTLITGLDDSQIGPDLWRVDHGLALLVREIMVIRDDINALELSNITVRNVETNFFAKLKTEEIKERIRRAAPIALQAINKLIVTAKNP